MTTACVLVAGLLAACGDTAKLPESATQGPQPQLPPPASALLPTLHIAPAEGWPAGGHPQAAAGFTVTAFAQGLQHPRSLLVLPNGDVLVAESDHPAPAPGEQEKHGVKAWISRQVQKRAGSGTPSADRITLLRDANGDGVAEQRNVFLTGLHSPFGMALVGDTLYIANADAVVRVPYAAGAQQWAPPPARSSTCPAASTTTGPRRWWPAPTAATSMPASAPTATSARTAWRRRKDARPSGKSILAAAASANSRPACAMPWGSRSTRAPAPCGPRSTNATSWAATSCRTTSRPCATAASTAGPGATGARTWTNACSRSGPRWWRGPSSPTTRSATTSRPWAWPSTPTVPSSSWNRKPLSGYKVVFVPFANGKPAGLPRDVLTGFVSPEGKAWGRPVGVALDRGGALLVADDVGGAVWRVAPVR